MRNRIPFICVLAAGCPASEPGPNVTEGNTGPDTELGSGPTTSGGTTVDEGTASSGDTTSGDSNTSETGPSASSSTGPEGMECLGADETLATAFLRVQPADREWVAPRGTPALIAFDCAPAVAAGGGVIDLICEDDTRKPTEQARFEVVTNLPALEVPLSSILDQAQVTMTFQAVPAQFGAAGIGWTFSVSSVEGALLILGQNTGSPPPGTVLPSPEVGWDQEFIVRDPGCAARPSFRDDHDRDRSLALEVPTDDGTVTIYDTDLDTVTLGGDIFTILVPNAFTVVETMCLACPSGDLDLIVVPGTVELP